MTTIGTSILTHDDSLLGVGKIKLLLNNEKKNPPSEDLDSVIGDPDPAPGDTVELRKGENLGVAVGKLRFHCADWQTESWSVAKREEGAPCMKTTETECRLHAP